MSQKELTELLVRASEAYYNSGTPIMSDLEFDQKLEELKKMESESGVIYPGSPTQNVGAGARVTELKRVTHERPALSLDKVKYKDREELRKWLGKRSATLSWKCDGSTVVLTYDDGKLTSAVTRGDGESGYDITHNARFFKGVPEKIRYNEHLVVRGEVMMSNAEFDRVNAEAGGIYENARNLANATIQMLDSAESKKREIIFKAFELVDPEPMAKIEVLKFDGAIIHYNSSFNLMYMQDRLNFVEALGFDTVEHEFIQNADELLIKIEEWKNRVNDLAFPTDGLVISYHDLVEGWKLGTTGHHPRYAMALKWTDETKETYIRDVEWSVGKTGVITPVAVFDPVRLGIGSNVTRASLHNLSIMERFKVRIGAKTNVYLANMIIPQITECENSFDGEKTCLTTPVQIPTVCPVCGQPIKVEENNGVKTLHCVNTSCSARQIGALMNTFSKDGLFIKGLGESQIEDLMEYGLVDGTPLSFYLLESRVDKDTNYGAAYLHLLDRDGWGDKKWNNLIDAINASRKTTVQKFLYSLNIPLLGNDLAKKLSKFWHNDIEEFVSFVSEVAAQTGKNDRSVIRKALDTLTEIEGVGEEKARNIVWWAYNLPDNDELKNLLALRKELNFPEEKDSAPADNSLEGLTFVITGAVHEYKNRDEFQKSVEARGGKVSGSVSTKTSFLVNNDVTSTSGKNQKAQELGVQIISEDEFIKRFGK